MWRHATAASSTARRAATARTARTPSGPVTTSTTWRSAAFSACRPPAPTAHRRFPARPSPTPRPAACTPRWPSRPPCSAGPRRARAPYLDVSVADGVLWLMSLAIDEQLALGGDVRPGHDVLSGRYACYATYKTADDRWLAVGAIEAKFFANLCAALGCEELAAIQYDESAQPRLRAGAGRGVRPTHAGRMGRAPGRRRHLRGAGPRRGRGRGRPPVLGPAGRRDGHPSDRGRAPTAGAAPGGHAPARTAWSSLPDMTGDTDTEHLLKEAGVDGETVARWVAQGVVA